MRILICSILLLTIVTITGAQSNSYIMLVSSRNNNSVKKFDSSTGKFLGDFISDSAFGLSLTQDLIEDPNGNILVSGRGNKGILLFDKKNGNFIKEFTNGYELDNPTKISFGPDGNLYISQWGKNKNCVARFDGSTGKFINEFTPSLALALDHAWDKEGYLYVSCYGSKDIRKFDKAGKFIKVFTEEGYLKGPTNLWFNKNGSLFVVDWELGSVLEFDSSTGKYIKTFISGLQKAEGFAFGPDGNLYLCDWKKNEIRRYTQDGSFIDVFADGGNMQAPNSILFLKTERKTQK